ncbi:CHAD domain-containing protein [Glycomyces sp. TRM65418]|uniref:CHAD domain-containing protein n=1 Tax=Glycomyces sp. TRM65418 TaxID=2867006 RepID=UPI001CE61965|nr:CHAD domain-containing protein [Glycomyces sp. TRM65418]MCC3763767.1 CHAD domain-containing protein [Glycomyces sp. TRM65418]QZD53478.1 CHAD domain-containing protein [Glycomyces sp. TRM65418]
MSGSGAPAAEAGPEPMTASTRAGVVVQAFIADNVEALNRAISALERNAPGSAGQVRVTIHRLRTVIRGYRRLFAETPYGGERLDRLLERLKHTEDLEKLRLHFAERFAQLGLTTREQPRWFRALEDERHASYLQIHGLASQTWVAALLSHVRLFAEHARFTREGGKPASSLMGTLSEAKTHLIDTYAKQRRAADPASARDATRVAARDLHYLAEAVAPALGRAAEDVLEPATALEYLLDRHRQTAIARNRLLRLPGADRADRLTAELAELEQEELRRLEEAIDRAATAMRDRWR